MGSLPYSANTPAMTAPSPSPPMFAAVDTIAARRALPPASSLSAAVAVEGNTPVASPHRNRAGGSGRSPARWDRDANIISASPVPSA